MIPPKILEPREIEDLCDIVEARILEKVKIDFRFEMESIKNKIMRAIASVPQYVCTKYGHKEVPKDFEVSILISKDRIDHVERPMGDTAGQFSRPRSQLKLKHRIEVSNFSSTLNLEDLIDWIGKLEDHFELEDIADPLRVMLA